MAHSLFSKKAAAILAALIAAFFFSNSVAALAAVPGQNQVFPGPYGSNGLLVSTSTNGSHKLGATTSPTVGSITATSSGLTSYFAGPVAFAGSSVNFLGESITNFTTYVRSLFSAGAGLSYSAGQFSLTSPVALTNGGTGASLADPGADRIFFWDDSDGATDWLEAGSGLTITGNTLSVSGGGITSLGPVGQGQTGATQTLASSTGSFNGLTIGITIVGNSDTQTFTPSLSGTLNNAGLTNSTISGIALGSNLAALTATDSTLTFSGSYTGATARTVGLNLANANTWTALQQFRNASTTLFSSYGPSYFGATATSSFSSTGVLTLATDLAVSEGGTGASTLTGVLKGNGTSAFTAGVDGTDFTLVDAVSCTNQTMTALTAAGVGTCSSINNAFWSGTDLSVANGGTGLSTFGGTNFILYTTAADTLSSEAAFTYNPTADRITASYASSTAISATTIIVDTTLRLFGTSYTTLAGLGAALVNAITAATPTGTWDFGGATSVEIPNGGPTVDTTGEIGIDTTSGQFKWSYNGSTLGIKMPYETTGFGFASSTQGAGTTTLRLGPAPFALTVVSVQCDFTNDMGISLYDGTNRANYLVGSSTIGTVLYTTNNTFTAGEAFRVDVGTSVNYAAAVSGGCTFKYTPTAD